MTVDFELNTRKFDDRKYILYVLFQYGHQLS